MAKITRGFFSDPHVVMGDQPIRGFMIKTSDVSRSVPWVHWTHHEKRAFGTNRNLQVFSIPKMHPSHSNSSKIEKWQYLPFLVVVEPPIQKKIFISTNHPNYGWKAHKCLKLPTSSLITLNIVPFCGIPEPSRSARFNLLNLEWWSWICNNGATQMEPIPSRFPISGGFKNRKKTHIFSKAR